jgi:hypothetical protein
MFYLIVLTHIMTNLMYLNDTIRDMIQNTTIHDTNYDSTSMIIMIIIIIIIIIIYNYYIICGYA